MMNEKDVFTIEKKIGYVFKDKQLLERAFTHGSVDKNALKNYQTLEFLGDSILDFIVAKRLMEINPNAHEGSLTKLRAAIVSREPLAEEIEHLDLAKYVIVGKGENADYIRSQPKIMSDIFESLIGAIYLDSKDIAKAERFILMKLANLFNSNSKHVLDADYKTQLNEFASKNDVKVEYEEIERSGPSHNPTFTVECKINGFHSGIGKGKSKREAEQQAAKEALDGIRKK